MSFLKLRNPQTAQAIRASGLRGMPMLGRGMFCAVFDKGDTVMKLTADSVQYAVYTDSDRPQCEHFPTLVKDYGDVGQQGDNTLYLVEMEKLRPLKRRADSDKAWVQRREILRGFNRHYRALCGQFKDIRNPAEHHRTLSAAILYEMSADDGFDAGVQRACEELWIFVSNFSSGTDFKRDNFMLRGETLVLNDVVSDIESILAFRSRRSMYYLGS